MRNLRSMTALAATGTILCLLASGAAAQQEDGCTQSSPCPIEVTVDEGGFNGDTNWTVTQGDWYQINVANLDLLDAHTVTLSGYGISIQVAPLGEESSEVFEFDQAGDYPLVDEPTGDTAWITVTELDAVAVEGGDATTTSPGDGTTGAGDADEDSPALPLLAILGAVAAVAILRRRA